MANQKALVFIAIGALFALVGAGIFVSGGFKAVMQDPTDGPLTATLAPANSGHFRALILNYPELFNCKTLNDDVYANADAEYAAYFISNEDIRDSARAYCRFHDGEQAWTFALFLMFTIVMLIVAVTALIRKSGYTLGLVGVGLSAFMLAFTLVTLAHFQSHSFVPQALNAFTDCEGFTDALKVATTGVSTTNNVVTAQFLNSLRGPSPRRGWICEDQFDYDSDLNTAANLVYAGAALSVVAYFALLIAFAYIVQPMVTPVPAFAKVGGFRSADVEFDSPAEYTYTYSEEEY